MRPLGSKYLLDTKIGHGGFGAVWSGADRDGHPYAIKILHEHLAADQETVTRFVQERHVVTQVTSPHVVGVHDLVVEGGSTLAIVMDLVEGGTLRDELTARGTLPAAEAVQVVAAVLEGLAAVHAAGAIHRDLKPENILLDRSSGSATPRVTDFGISRLVNQARKTSSGAVIGTPAYMPPESARGDSVGAAGDVYAAGIVLYELLCGVTPFEADHPLAALQLVLTHRPGRPSGLPDALWALLERMVARDAAGRPSAAAASAELSRLTPSLQACAALPRLDKPPAARPAAEPTIIADKEPAVPAQPHGEKERSSSGRRFVAVGSGLLAAVVLMGGAAIALSGESSTPTRIETAGAEDVETRSPSPRPSATESPSPTPTPTPSATASPSPSDEPALVQEGDSSGEVTHFLAEIPPVQVSGHGYLSGENPIAINGTTFAHAVGIDVSGCGEGRQLSMEWNLARGYRTFSAVLGLPDDAPSDEADLVEIYADGNKIFSNRFTLGKPQQVTLDVTNVLRLRIDDTVLSPCASTDQTMVAMGDPVLKGLAGEVPAAPTAG